MAESLSPPTAGKQMELEGNLGAFKLNDILQFLTMGKLTGVLSLHQQGQDAELMIREGKLVGAQNSSRQMKIGQHLIYNASISRKELEDALASQATIAPDKMLGEYLVERELVTIEQLNAVLELQIKEELWELFTWTEGTFKFEHGQTPQIERYRVSLRIDVLIKEGLERLAAWQAIVRNLNDPYQVFQVHEDFNPQKTEALKPNCWRVLSLINGRHTVKALTYLSGLGRFESLSALDELIGLEIIEPVMAKSNAPQATQDTKSVSGSPTAVERPQVKNKQPAKEKSGGFFGFGKREKPGEATAQQPTPRAPMVLGPADNHYDFVSAVGCCCAFMNQFYQALASEGSLESSLLAHWQSACLQYPLADMIVATENGLDAQTFERYADRAGGVDEHLQTVFDDCLESLGQLGKQLQEESAEEAILKRIEKQFISKASIRWPEDFDLESWMRQWQKNHTNAD